MKKISIALTVLLVASFAAHAQSTTTANVMGYSKVNLAPGFTMMRTPFLDGANAIGIQSIMSTNGLTMSSIAGTGDQILFWDLAGSKYDIYYLHDGTNGKLLVPEKLGKWIDNSTGLIASNSVAPGTGFFFVKAGEATVTNMFSGDIVIAETGTNSLELADGLNMVANPFSSAFSLNSIITNWIDQGALASSVAGVADQILFWDPVGLKYDTYYLHDGTNGKLLLPEKLGKWIDASTGLIASNSIPINTAFFYSRTIGAGTLTIEIEQSYNLD